MKCNTCNKRFANYRALNGHKSTHNRSKHYSDSRKKVPRTFECIECNVSVDHGFSKTNKYCSRECQTTWRWKNILVPEIEAGNKTHHSSAILKRYLREKFGDQCSNCTQLPNWDNKHLELQLDHKDGNSDNNKPSNLRLLCPNCHTQTENYGSKGKGSRYHKITTRNKYIRQYRGSLAQR